MSNQDWTSKLQDQLADYQESVSHDLWAGIEQSLAQNNIDSVSSNPQTIASESSEAADLHVGSEAKKNARIVYFKRWSAAAAAVALLGIGGSYVYLHQESAIGCISTRSIPRCFSGFAIRCISKEDG